MTIITHSPMDVPINSPMDTPADTPMDTLVDTTDDKTPIQEFYSGQNILITGKYLNFITILKIFWSIIGTITLQKIMNVN